VPTDRTTEAVRAGLGFSTVGRVTAVTQGCRRPCNTTATLHSREGGERTDGQGRRTARRGTGRQGEPYGRTAGTSRGDGGAERTRSYDQGPGT